MNRDQMLTLLMTLENEAGRVSELKSLALTIGDAVFYSPNDPKAYAKAILLLASELESCEKAIGLIVTEGFSLVKRNPHEDKKDG